MPRSVRVEYDRAIYHEMSRWDHGEKIFLNGLGRVCFLETVGVGVPAVGGSGFWRKKESR